MSGNSCASALQTAPMVSDFDACPLLAHARVPLLGEFELDLVLVCGCRLQRHRTSLSRCGR